MQLETANETKQTCPTKVIRFATLIEPNPRAHYRNPSSGLAKSSRQTGNIDEKSKWINDIRGTLSEPHF